MSSAEFLRLLEARLHACEALAESLMACRSAFAAGDLSSIMQWVERQSAHCIEIQRLEAQLASACSNKSQMNLLSSDESLWADELSRRTAHIKRSVQQLNRTYAELIRKTAHNNGVLRNLYATALIYADPRLGPGAAGCGKAGG
jgi:hypothetical protein